MSYWMLERLRQLREKQLGLPVREERPALRIPAPPPPREPEPEPEDPQRVIIIDL